MTYYADPRRLLEEIAEAIAQVRRNFDLKSPNKNFPVDDNNYLPVDMRFAEAALSVITDRLMEEES